MRTRLDTCRGTARAGCAMTFCLVTLLIAGCSSDAPASDSGANPPTAGQSKPEPESTDAGDSGPAEGVRALRIDTVRSGEEITLPTTIGYRLEGADIANAGYRIRAWFNQRGVYTAPITSSEGKLRVPSDKLLAGHRDVTFTVIDSADRRVADFEPVVIHDVMIIGPK